MLVLQSRHGLSLEATEKEVEDQLDALFTELEPMTNDAGFIPRSGRLVDSTLVAERRPGAINFPRLIRRPFRMS